MNSVADAVRLRVEKIRTDDNEAPGTRKPARVDSMLSFRIVNVKVKVWTLAIAPLT